MLPAYTGDYSAGKIRSPHTLPVWVQQKATAERTNDNESAASSCQSDVNLMLIGDKSEILSSPSVTGMSVNLPLWQWSYSGQQHVVPFTPCIHTHTHTFMIHDYMSQWSSGSMSDCSARGPGIESRCGQLCLSHNHCDLQPWARAVCTFPAVSRSTQPSTLCGTVNEYQLSGWVIIINGDGGCRR